MKKDKTSASLLFLLAVPLLGAEDRTQPENLVMEPLKVSATRLENSPFAQPYSFHRLDRASIDMENSRTLTDTADRAPGVAMQKTAANQASPFIRGLTGEQTLLMFDGVRLNNALFRPGANQYAALLPAEAVDSVDVILGSGATIMGSDGLTGAMDFRLAPAGRDAAKASSPYFKARAASAESAIGGAAGVDGRSGKWAYTVEGSREESGNLKGGKDSGSRLSGSSSAQDDIPNTAYDQFSFGTRLSRSLGPDDNAIELSLGRVQQNKAPRPDGYVENSGVSTRLSRYYDPQRFDYLHLRHNSAPLGPMGRLRTTLWLHGQHEKQFREDLQGSGASARYRMRSYEDSVSTLGADLQFSRASGRHEFAYGLTAYRDDIDASYASFRSPAGNISPAAAIPFESSASTPGQATVPDGSEYTGTGVFVQDSLSLSGKWGLLAGLRHDRSGWKIPITADRPGYASGGNTTVDGDDDALCASLRLSYVPAKHFLIFLGAGQGFRAPTVSDLAGIQDRASAASGGQGPQIQGNPGLSSERSLSLEWGVKYEKEKDRASLSLFRTNLDDLIQIRYADLDNDGRFTSADEAKMVNAESGIIQGAELASDIGDDCGLPGHKRLSFFQSTSFVMGEADVPQKSGALATEHISKANQLFGRFGVKFEDTRSWYALVQSRWAGRYDRPAPGDATDTRHTTAGTSDGSMPGWAALDLKAGWHSPDGLRRLDFGLENLFNATYRQVGSGTDGPGLNLVVGAMIRI